MKWEKFSNTLLASSPDKPTLIKFIKARIKDLEEDKKKASTLPTRRNIDGLLIINRKILSHLE